MRYRGASDYSEEGGILENAKMLPSYHSRKDTKVVETENCVLEKLGLAI